MLMVDKKNVTRSIEDGKHHRGNVARKAFSEIIAPLGKPELPLVYIIVRQSSGSILT